MSDEDCDKDEDDEENSDGCGSKEGNVKGSKANKPREVTAPHMKLSQQHCIKLYF